MNVGDASSSTPCITSRANSTATRTHNNFENPNGSVGSITTNGSATAYNTSSDYRLKEQVAPIDDALTRLAALKPIRFNWIKDPERQVDGFLAHEVEGIVPEAVTGQKDALEAIGELLNDLGQVVRRDTVRPNSLQDGWSWRQTGERPVYQGIDQSKLVPLLVAAVQALAAEVDALKGR